VNGRGLKSLKQCYRGLVSEMISVVLKILLMSELKLAALERVR
jgi:hypothetical protein